MQVVEACFVFRHLGDEEVGFPCLIHSDVHDDRLGLGSVVFFHFCEDHISFVVSEREGAALYVAGYVFGNE